MRTLVVFMLLRENAWARQDSNLGPSPRQGDIIATRPRALMANFKSSS